LERRRPFDILISNSSVATILLRVLTSPRRIVYYVHDSLYSDRPQAGPMAGPIRYLLNHVIETIALRSADRVICASDGIATQVRSAGIPAEKLSVMYPLLRRLPSASLRPGRESSAEIVRRMRPFLLSVGQQTGRKRFDLLIGSLRQLRSDLRLVLVGDGPMNSAYRAQAVREGVGGRVEFLTEAEDDTLDLLYENCAAYVLASESEGFPITIAEALAHGSPVVLVCPSTREMGAAFGLRHAIVLEDLSVDAVARGVREVLERSGPEPDAVRPAIRQWAARYLPSDEEIRQKYDLIFGSLLGPATA
jgi:glycosyltransferase involved in cell wall biosynthesis